MINLKKNDMRVLCFWKSGRFLTKYQGLSKVEVKRGKPRFFTPDVKTPAYLAEVEVKNIGRGNYLVGVEVENNSEVIYLAEVEVKKCFRGFYLAWVEV